MSPYRVSPAAGRRIDEIYVYTRDIWGDAQAERYVRGLFQRFQAIADRNLPWRPIPPEFEVDGYVCRYERHFIYWKVLEDGAVGIVTLLHARMHQIDRFREDLEP